VKFITLLVLAFSFSAFAQDELGRELGKKCESPEVKKLTGATGSCRVVVAPKSYKKKLVCAGNLGTVNCLTTFDPEKAEKLNLTCTGAERINYNFEATGTSHSIATVIQKADGQDAVEISASEIVLISSDTVNVRMEESKTAKTAAISLTFQAGYTVNLQNVQCQ
jgi:hypothetical protein